MTPETKIPVAPGDRNDFVIITPSSAQASPNFTYSELFNSKVGRSSHPLSRQVIDCAQFLRDYFGLPIRITSTYRNYVPTGGASYSPHMIGVAIDLQFDKSSVPAAKRDELYTVIRDDFKRKGAIFQGLWERGCRGFGSYDTFVHIDTCHIELYPKMKAKRGTTYRGENFAFWNKMQRLRRIPAPAAIPAVFSDETPEPDVSVIDSIPADNVIGKAVLEGIGTAEGLIEEFFNDEDRLSDVSGKGVANMVIIMLVVGIILAGIVYAIMSFQ